jgi:hypothetical protein
MRHIIENRFLKAFTFSSMSELSTFVNSQKAERILSIENALCERYYCYICYHSLTLEKQFVISFGSSESEENLNFMFWGNLLLLDTGEDVYLIDETLKVRATFDITTPLVGLYLINDENILLLQEAYLRVINKEGEMIKRELFDLMEDFNIKGNILSIQTSEEAKVIVLA